VKFFAYWFNGNETITQFGQPRSFSSMAGALPVKLNKEQRKTRTCQFSRIPTWPLRETSMAASTRGRAAWLLATRRSHKLDIDSFRLIHLNHCAQIAATKAVFGQVAE
jgi:hypothetical protein